MKELFSSKGRYSRSKFLGRFISISIIHFIIVMALFLTRFVYVPSIVLYLSIPYLIIVFMSIIKRLHDQNLDSRYVLLAFVPLLNIGFFISIIFMKGTVGPNNYDHDVLNEKCLSQISSMNRMKNHL